MHFKLASGSNGKISLGILLDHAMYGVYSRERKFGGRANMTRGIRQLAFEHTDSTPIVPSTLPSQVKRVQVPPIKCQGIKTKLVPFILSEIRWSGTGRWIEPFVGSGVVALNLAPARALLTDVNPHVIRFYQDIADNVVTPQSAKEFLRQEGCELLRKGEEHYYEVRRRFNASPTSHDFLFLNRSCFNGNDSL